MPAVEFSVSNDGTNTWNQTMTVGAATRVKIDYRPWLDDTRGERVQSFSPTIPLGATGTTFAAGPATIANAIVEPNPREVEFLIGGPFSAGDAWQVQINIQTTLGQVRNDVIMCSAVALP